MRRWRHAFRFWAVLLTAFAAVGDEPDAAGAWPAGYALRYRLELIGEGASLDARTAIASLPTGGWLKPDISDLMVFSNGGRKIPLAVLSHDPRGDTIIQFRRDGDERLYWAYAHNPEAPDKDLDLAQRIVAAREASELALRHKMAVTKESAAKAGELRDLSAKIDREKATLADADKTLAAWTELLPERQAAATAAAVLVPPAAEAAKQAADDLAPVAKKGDDETAKARALSRAAAAARKTADAAAAAHQRALAALDMAQSELTEAQERELTLGEAACVAAVTAETAETALQASIAELRAERAAAATQEAQEKEAETDEEASGKELSEAARERDVSLTALEEKLAAVLQGQQEQEELSQKAWQAVEAAQAEVARLAGTLPGLQAALPPLLAAREATEAAAVPQEATAAEAGEAAKQARLAAAPFAAAEAAAQKKLESLRQAAKATKAAQDEAEKVIAGTSAIKAKTEATLATLLPLQPPAEKAADEAAAAVEAAITDAQEKEQYYFDMGYEAEPRLFKEGLTVEFREWAGDKLDSWADVVAGLQQSENILGNAIVREVLQNVNPFRRSDPRAFAASYRGYLEIDQPGIYSFCVNGDDSCFLFMNGYKVYSRTRATAPVTGEVPLYSVGADIQLEAGVHPVEIHNIIGNSPSARGLCSLMWLVPGSKAWKFVPPAAFTTAALAVTTAIEAVDGKPVAAIDFGMDDALSSDGMTLYLAKFEALGCSDRAAPLTWQFGDGLDGVGVSPTHVYFAAGDYEASLESHELLPPFRRRCHVWEPPRKTGPLSLARAVKALDSVDVSNLPVAVQNDIFHFLLICEQPTRWPLMERLCTNLLQRQDLDVKYRAYLHQSLMTAMAELGRGASALERVDTALLDVGRFRTLQMLIELAAANIEWNNLKDFQAADRRYAAMIDENQRLRHPLLRRAAIEWGDMAVYGGDLAKARQAYTLARSLGGIGAVGETQSDPVKRGALLRVAEQQLRGGELEQTRRLLERIEAEFPEQKLEGLYRFLRGEAERRAGYYDAAVWNYELLLKLQQSVGYRANALYGIADACYRMDQLPRALDWLAELKDSFPGFYAERRLTEYEALVRARFERLQAAAAEDPDAAAFSSLCIDFEPGSVEAVTTGELPVSPGLGIVGGQELRLDARGGARQVELSTPVLNRLPPHGTLWVEVWYKDIGAPAGINDARYLQATSIDESGAEIDSVATHTQRTFGDWRKMVFSLKSPPTFSGAVTVTAGHAGGVLQLDGLTVQHVGDRQTHALRTFIAGADPQ